MTPYKSKSRKKSGVTAFRIGKDHIVVEFKHSEIYTYSYDTAGKPIIEKMKALALAQDGLSTFISRHQPNYVR